uniref:Uncharacterized protein n=1 Tax=Arundo donax TaxID=35708 RepID=A0A0A9DWB1_ARUDO
MSRIIKLIGWDREKTLNG